MKKDTPLMQQYNQTKAKYPDALLLFRVGDFYETFDEDAVKASSALGITLTKRRNGSSGETLLAGIPYHSLDNYLPKLVRAGYRVAICEQLEDPKTTKTIVKRGVTEIITPGLASSESILDSSKNNFLASIFFQDNDFGISFIDISTGDFLVANGSEEYIDKLLESYQPTEIIYPKNISKEYINKISLKFYTYPIDEWVYGEDYSKEILLNKFETNSLKGFGIENFNNKTKAASAILHYLKTNQQNKLDHINKISVIGSNEYIWMDGFSIRNLELIYSNTKGGTSLFDILNLCNSNMGARMLQKWILMPLLNIDKINFRLSIVDFFYKNETIRLELNNALKNIGDLERLISKISLGKANPRDIVQLKKSLYIIEKVISLIKSCENKELTKYLDKLYPCKSLSEEIETKILDEPAVNINKECIFKRNFNSELDEILFLMTQGKEYLLEIQNREIQSTSINNLKIGFNNVFGYFLEVTNSHKEKVPESWIRKQTLSNAERYITPELKEYENKILGAEDRMFRLQNELWNSFLVVVSDYIEPILTNAKILSEIDCMLSLSEIAIKNNYLKPTVDDSIVIDLKQSRHPVIEKKLPIGENYVENDILLDNNNEQIILLTGPNMSGKSAILRQTALIVIMAQMGSFVPAKSCNIGIVDKLFTRVGANDNLSMGESTFMVEMNETSTIVNNITERSLILLDEIGRGTSTYDGISIAWALTEFIHFSDKKPKTLFATHYHELNELNKTLNRVQNFHISSKEIDGKILFLRKLIKGGSEHSFGIHVAKLAGMPKMIIQRAENIIKELEQKSLSPNSLKNELPKIIRQNTYQMSIFDQADPEITKLRDDLKSLNTDTLTPIEALLKISEWKQLIKK